MLAAQVNTDYRLALNFLVLLNVNLAILNLLPIPVLDGGHILMALIEKIRGRPLSVQVRRIHHHRLRPAADLLHALRTFFDFKRFPLFRAPVRARRPDSSRWSRRRTAPPSAPAPAPTPMP